MALSPIEKQPAWPTPERQPAAPEGGEVSREARTAPEAASRQEYQPIRPAVNAPAAAPTAVTADEARRKYEAIEKVLEEDLGEIYNNLTPAEQKLFKMKGEEAARNIFKLVYHQAKVKVKKIIKAIRSWLKSVPGINKYFLEQEAKLKADKIVKLADTDQKIEY